MTIVAVIALVVLVGGSIAGVLLLRGPEPVVITDVAPHPPTTAPGPSTSPGGPTPSPSTTTPSPSVTKPSPSGTKGSFDELRLPATFSGYESTGLYADGDWIGAPEGSVSNAAWYEDSSRRRLVASIVHHGLISDLNPYSFEDRQPVGDATCGVWLSRYTACFLPRGDGFVGVQVADKALGNEPTQKLVTALSAVL